MARVTIESDFQSDPRYQNLLLKIGNRHMAIGIMVDLWGLAQKYWYPEKKPIPKHVFEAAGLPLALVECGLVVESEDGFRARGSEASFAWRFDKVEAGRKGGTVSASRSRDSHGRLLPKQAPSSDQAKPSTSKPLTTSLTTSTSLTKLSKKEVRTKGELALDHVENHVGYFIGAYVRAFQTRYGEKTRPDLRGKVQGQIKTFLKDYPLERAIYLIEAYCQMDGKREWFKTKGHDFGTFLENLNPISIALEKGEESPGKINWDTFFVDAEKKAAS